MLELLDAFGKKELLKRLRNLVLSVCMSEDFIQKDLRDEIYPIFLLIDVVENIEVTKKEYQ